MNTSYSPPHNYECTSSISCKKQAKVLENEKHLPLPNNLKNIGLCIHVLVPTIITIIIHTKHQMKIIWMVNHVQTQNGHSLAMKTTIQAQQFHNTKMQILNIAHKTPKNLRIIVECLGISNHRKWFEITQTRIISYPHNISNHIYTWTGSK
jgi:D-ribose pyranose/furanose isomerase RbsD